MQTTLLLTLIIIASKVAGFVREMVMSATFGLSVESDAYSVSYSILSIFTILFGAAIGSTFIPIYTQSRVELGEKRANDYAVNVLNLYILVAIPVSILGYIFAPAITGVMWQNAEGAALVTENTQLMMPSLVCWAMSGVLVNLLDARKHFVPEQIIGFALSFCVILACLVFGTIQSVSIATSITALVQVGMLLPFLRGQLRWRPYLNLHSRRLIRTFLLALPALISVAFDEINHAADKIFGSEIGIGVVSALGKSYTLVQTAISVLVVPITTVMFTQLSQYVAHHLTDDVRRTIRSSVEMIAFITLPIIVICVAMAPEIIQVFYQRGAFGPEQTAFTVPVFAAYIIGIFGFGLRNFLTRVFYSLQKTRLPMYIGMFSVSLNIFLDWLWKDTLGGMGLTLATSVASLAGAMVMLFILQRHLGGMQLGRSAGQLMRILLCTFAAWVFMALAGELLPSSDRFLGVLMILVVRALVGLAVYFAAAYALNIRVARRVSGILLGRLRRTVRQGM
ncbi:MAG: murein biosynthesis integral membrane protein MurJ [Clostridia bacterium]|nr:murein biosynthesis integral membrane protein MurJ [Clostridia bacterium]